MADDFRDKAGKYDLDLGDEELVKRVAAAEMWAPLDDAARLVVTLSWPTDDAEKLRASALPQQAKLTWAGRGLFQGHLSRVLTPGRSRVALVYRDGLQRSSKISEDRFSKPQTLQECLDKIAGRLELSARFHGSFGEAMPGFSWGGKPLETRLRDLGARFGFYFTCRSLAGALHFVKLGSSIQSASCDAMKQALDVSLLASGEGGISEVQWRYFDSKEMKSLEKKLSTSELYAPLSAFTSHAGYKEKLGWKLAQGQAETHVGDLAAFEAGASSLTSQLSKRLMEQETVTIRAIEPLALPGDKLSLKRAPLGGLQDGDYLVQAVTVRIASSTPVADIVAIRP